MDEKSKKLDIKKENGLWLYAVEMSTEKECAIYFDNLYNKTRLQIVF